MQFTVKNVYVEKCQLIFYHVCFSNTEKACWCGIKAELKQTLISQWYSKPREDQYRSVCIISFHCVSLRQEFLNLRGGYFRKSYYAIFNVIIFYFISIFCIACKTVRKFDIKLQVHSGYL